MSQAIWSKGGPAGPVHGDSATVGGVGGASPGAGGDPSPTPLQESVRQLVTAFGGSVTTDVGPAGPAGSGSDPVRGYGPQIEFEGGDGHFRCAVTPLLEYGLLKVHGADAAAFLQAQLTNDVANLADGEVRLAGYCSVKGRVMATFWVWRESLAQTFWLACSRDIAATVARRLSMFVLRAKAKVEDYSDRIALIGVMRADGEVQGLPAQCAPESAEVMLPPTVVPAALVAAIDGAGVATTSDVRISRALHPVPSDALVQTLQQLGSQGARLLSTPVWRRLEVLSGIARINASNQELFVPQMVNLELVGGVSFKKGCYPGQEIVARSQYLGKLKRRMFLGVGSGSVPAPGADVEVQGAAEPVGQVVLAAPLADGDRFAVLFESLTSAVPPQLGPRDAVIHIGATPITPLSLPYAIPPTAPAAGRATAAPDAVG